jgi:hypothetical protein
MCEQKEKKSARAQIVPQCNKVEKMCATHEEKNKQ